MIEQVHSSFRSDRNNQIKLELMDIEVIESFDKEAKDFLEYHQYELWREEWLAAANLLKSNDDFAFLKILVTPGE